MLDYIYQVNGCLRGCSRLQQNSQDQILSRREYAWDQPLSMRGRRARKSRRAPICLWGVLSEGYCHSESPGIEMLNANMFHGKSNVNHKEPKPGWMAAPLTTMPAQHPCGPAAHSYVLSHLPSILPVHSHIYALTISSFLSKPAQLSLSFVWLLWNFLVVPIWLSELRIHLFLTPVSGKVVIHMPKEWEWWRKHFQFRDHPRAYNCLSNHVSSSPGVACHLLITDWLTALVPLHAADVFRHGCFIFSQIPDFKKNRCIW